MEDAGGQRRRYVNAGVGRWFGPVYTSLTHGRVLGTSGYDGVGEPWNLVLSADLELAPGLLLAGDVAYFDNDLDRGRQGRDRRRSRLGVGSQARGGVLSVRPRALSAQL